MENKLVDYLKKSATLIVPSRRLCATLGAKMNDIFAQTRLRWDTPRIFALEDWFQALWDQFEICGLASELLLSPSQCLLHFEDIIVRSESGKGLLRQHQAAKTALQAWHDLNYWQHIEVLFQPPENCDQGAFQIWAKEYQLWLKKNHFIDNANLPQKLLPLLLEKKNDTVIRKVSPVNRLVLYGFEELPPLIAYFFKSLAEQAWQIDHQEAIKITPKKMLRVSFLQQEQECISAANWAKALIAKGQSNIAIVVPNLADMRNKLDTIFKDTFDPFHLLNPSLNVCPNFNISAAIPLIQYPIILEAFSCLKLGKNAIEEIEVLLTSAFSFGAETEKFARIQLLGLVKALKSKVSLNSLLQLIEKHPEINVPTLHDKILKLINFFADVPHSQSYGQWVKTFKKILSIVGFPGARSLNSVEYQLVQRLDAFFEELGLCDSITEACPTYYQVLTTLEKVSANIPFQPENKNAKIQILGLLEAAGATYDHLWVMGMHSEAWPPHPTPNPFVSIELQRQLQMPHADANRELQYAQKITQRFKESAKEIIFSYPTKDKEKSLNVSELIQDIPLATNLFVCEPMRLENYFKQGESFLEEIEDQKAPCANEAIHHGSNTLTLQGACPFKAFAEIRLNLKQPQRSSIWLAPQEQGIVVHHVLAEFWRVVKTQDALLHLTQEDLDLLTRSLVEKHLKKISFAQTPLPYLEVEKCRLNTLLQTYFQLEKQRDPFKVVYIEHQQNYEISQMNFAIRIDRIDETIKGDNILIDYKTGKFDLSTLWGDRLSAQLPLYFLANKHLDLKALMILKLNSFKATFEGVSEKSDMPIPWSDLYSYWQDKLERLAQNFKEGHAAVDPLSYQQTCRYCHLKPLCRIHERQANE